MAMANIIIKKEHRSDYSRERERQSNIAKSIKQSEDRERFNPLKDNAARGDFRLCKESDKQYADYRKFKSTTAREKIKDNLEQIKKENQRRD